MIDLIIVLALSTIVGSLIYFLRLPKYSQKQGLDELKRVKWWLSTPDFRLILAKRWWMERKQKVPGLFRQHRKLVTIFVIANILDLITTYIALRAGFTEKNPIITDLVTDHFWVAAICKMLGTLAIIYAVLFLKRLIMFYWFNVGFLFVAITNAMGTLGAHLGVVKPY